MNSDDDQYAVLRELLESGALSRKDVSEETLKLVYGGEANVPSVPTVDKNPDLSWAQLPPKVEQPKVSYDQIGVKKTTPPAVAVFADNPSKKNYYLSNGKIDKSKSKDVFVVIKNLK